VICVAFSSHQHFLDATIPHREHAGDSYRRPLVEPNHDLASLVKIDTE